MRVQNLYLLPTKFVFQFIFASYEKKIYIQSIKPYKVLMSEWQSKGLKEKDIPVFIEVLGMFSEFCTYVLHITSGISISVYNYE